VIIYYASIEPLSDDAYMEAKLQQVNMQRRAKVLRCKQKKDRMRALAAGLLLRLGMEERGIDYESAVFAEDGAGKPLLLSDPDFCYNISHSGHYAACAVWDRDLGLDIECISERFSGDRGERLMKQVAAHSFTEAERNALAEAGEELRPEAFAKIWTAKESYAKYKGTGIAMDFSAIDTIAERGFFGTHLCDFYLSAYAGGEEIVPTIKKIDLQ
jgi:4'-phosphopantetheinyl transferase